MKRIRLVRTATPQERAEAMALLSWQPRENLLYRPEPAAPRSLFELERVRQVNLEYLSKMPNFVADETAQRYENDDAEKPWRLYDTIEDEITFKGVQLDRRNIRQNDLRLGPTAPEIAVYTPAQAALEHTGVSGRSSVWLKGAAGPDPYRYFLFTRKGICFLYDRKLKSEIPLFSVFPNPMLDIDMPPDGRYIYVTQTIHDADLWLAHLGR
jgi:hypothetical protein